MAMLKDILVGERWAYRSSDADIFTEVEVRGISHSKPARVEIVYVALPETVLASVPPSRLKVRWSERDRFLQRETQWRGISSQPDDIEFRAVSTVISEFVSPAATIGWGKGKSGTIAIHDVDLVDVFIGGGLDGILQGAAHVAHGGAVYYAWPVAVVIAERTCRFKPERVMAYVQGEETRDRLESSVARTAPLIMGLHETPLGSSWDLLREWCGQNAASSDQLARARADAAQLAALFAAAVALIAERVNEVTARKLFARAYPHAPEVDWRVFLKKAVSFAE